MLLTFLSACIPLTKIITHKPGESNPYYVKPYPNVRAVTSHEIDCPSILDLADILNTCGKEGWCLLKGSLDQPLINESREGHKVEELHYWIVFDFDKVNCPPTHEGALEAIKRYLPPCCHNVSCIVQLSASAFNPTTQRLSCHVFMQLAEPATTQHLKQWIENINFNSPLIDELKLSDSNIALHFPLDRCVTSPARLIYIAPPVCRGFNPTLADPIRLIKRYKPTLEIPAFQPIDQSTIRSKISELRAKAGLPDQNTNCFEKDGQEILTGIGECAITDRQPSGDHYIRFNLNGGDSLAYFIDLYQPYLIGNFKGEPYLYTREVAPDWYKQLSKLPAPDPTVAHLVGFAFYATNLGSALKIGTHDPERGVLKMYASHERAAASWMLKFGMPPKSQPYPHAEVVYDVTSDHQYQHGVPLINLYQRTDFIKKYANIGQSQADVANLKTHCPVIYGTLLHVLGDSMDALNYFCNWLAHIFQTRQRSMTAWLLHGVEGTGKGVIVDKVLGPLFGIDNISTPLLEDVDTKFNPYCENKLFVVVNEVVKNRTFDHENIMSKLRSWITDPYILITAKGQDPRSVPNHANFIFCSNHQKSVTFESHDRRFNVGEYQTARKLYDPNEWAIIEQGEELDSFAQFLGSWVINRERLLIPYGGASKTDVYEQTHTLLEQTANAIITGDANFFANSRPNDLLLKYQLAGAVLPLTEYDLLVYYMVKKRLTVLTLFDLQVLFTVVCAGTKYFPVNKLAQRKLYAGFKLLPETNATYYDKRTKKAVRGRKAPRWLITLENKREVIESFETKYPNKKLSPEEEQEDSTNIIPFPEKLEKPTED